MNMNKKTVSALMVIAAGSMWGLMGLLVRRLNALGLGSLEVCFIRVSVAFICFALILLIFDRKAFVIRLKDIWCFIGTGVVSMACFTFCYFKTMTLTSLSVAAVLLYTSPVFVMLLSAVLFKEKLTRMKLLAALAAFLGCAFVSGIVGGAGRLSAQGVLLGLGAGLGYALYSIFGRCALERGYSSATISLYTFFFAMLATGLMADITDAVSAVTASLPSALITVLLILIVTLFPYLLYTKGLQGLENGTAAILASIEPVVATVLGTIVFSERLGVWNIVGIAMVLASIVIINRGTQAKAEI